MADRLPGLGAIGEDRLLDGKLVLRQPRKGHRAGSDAVLLAASLPELGEGPLLDMGAGVGTIGLAAALAQPLLRVVLLERDPELAGLASENAGLNGVAERVTVVTGDIAGPAAGLGLSPASFACVAMNPPFYSPHANRTSPVPNRAAAHVEEAGLEVWLRAVRRLLKPRGRLLIVHRAEALPDLLAGLATGFGGVAIRPVHAQADQPAIRILVAATLGSKKPAALLPALVLHRPDGGFTPEAEALHRGRARLPLAEAGAPPSARAPQ